MLKWSEIIKLGYQRKKKEFKKLRNLSKIQLLLYARINGGRFLENAISPHQRHTYKNILRITLSLYKIKRTASYSFPEREDR